MHGMSGFVRQASYNNSDLISWASGGWQDFPKPLWGELAFDRITKIRTTHEASPIGRMVAEVDITSSVFPTDILRIFGQMAGFFAAWNGARGNVCFDCVTR